MSVKSQELIQQLLKAEKQAEELIARARENRVLKLKQAKDSADEELKKFRDSEEAKFQSETGSRAAVDPAADMKATTKMELDMVSRDYQQNKDQASNYITSKILQVPLELSAIAKSSLVAVH
eukprot:gnl/MRDRNA2_/MRDRNA2_30165_c0_seq1.p1 gnl/MRDRNA2_/MRDRNA2_30165_c0~~gnl/MRDRNA2_/MRDRNA2_30165_c0_seq1.p1  ORF type:complete len:122 (+),score=39.01 gnl/MRDRNA2_/MRDRNA2_30165_c0_seq1:89-454(+)